MHLTGIYASIVHDYQFIIKWATAFLATIEKGVVKFGDLYMFGILSSLTL